jgi:hypothetical protein
VPKAAATNARIAGIRNSLLISPAPFRRGGRVRLLTRLLLLRE